MKTPKKIFITILFFFMHASAMELTLPQIIALPKEGDKVRLSEKIFKYADFQTNKRLLSTCKTLQSLRHKDDDYSDETLLLSSGELGLTLHSFINGAYKFKGSGDSFSELSRKCIGEYEKSLINYYVEYGKKCRDAKRIVLDNYLVDKNFTAVLKNIVSYNSKRRVKYYIPHSNVLRCINLFKKDMSDVNYQDEWSAEKTFADLLHNDVVAQRVVQDICSFFNRACSVENFIAIYNEVRSADTVDVESVRRAVTEQNIPVLELFQDSEVVQGSLVKNYIYDVHTDAEREILAKADFYIAMQPLMSQAIADKATDKVCSFFKIFADQGNDFNKCQDLLKIILEGELSEVVSVLFAEGFRAAPDTIESLSGDQIKIYVEQGYKICEKNGENFWDDKHHQKILHKAVRSNDIALVKYLLSLGAPTNVIDYECKTPILYSLNNDKLFNILVQIPPLNEDEEREKKQHQLFCSIVYTNSNARNNLKLFIRDNSENNIIQLFKNEFFTNGQYLCLLDAIAYQKNSLFEFLFDKVTSDMGEVLGEAIRHYNFQVMRFLLERGVNAFVVNDYEVMLELLNNEDLIKSFKIHQTDITAERQQKLLSWAIEIDTYKKQTQEQAVQQVTSVENTCIGQEQRGQCVHGQQSNVVTQQFSVNSDTNIGDESMPEHQAQQQNNATQGDQKPCVVVPPVIQEDVSVDEAAAKREKTTATTATDSSSNEKTPQKGPFYYFTALCTTVFSLITSSIRLLGAIGSFFNLW